MCRSKIVNAEADIANLDFDSFLEADFNVFNDEQYSFDDIFNDDMKPKVTQDMAPINPSYYNIKPEIRQQNFSKKDDREKDEYKEKKSSHPELVSVKSNKLMTREQFYKLRPKLPRISKADPRRAYASYFSSAMNSCDINIIWDFLCDYCASDADLIQTWTGEDSYLNFPKCYKVKNIENIVEYLFRFILLIPDLLMELGNAKIYVRSDGISRLVSQISINGTRPFDGDLSERIMLEPIKNSLSNNFSYQNTPYMSSPASSYDGYTTNNSSDSEGSYDHSERVNTEDNNNNHNNFQTYPTLSTLYTSAHSELIDNISDRVYDKMDTILSSVQPCLNAKRILTGSKRKFNEVISDPAFYNSPDFTSSFAPSYVASTDSSYDYNLYTPPPVKLSRRLPSSSKVTIHGLVTLHINKDFRISSIEISYSSSPFSL